MKRRKFYRLVRHISSLDPLLVLRRFYEMRVGLQFIGVGEIGSKLIFASSISGIWVRIEKGGDLKSFYPIFSL